MPVMGWAMKSCCPSLQLFLGSLWSGKFTPSCKKHPRDSQPGHGNKTSTEPWLPYTEARENFWQSHINSEPQVRTFLFKKTAGGKGDFLIARKTLFLEIRRDWPRLLNNYFLGDRDTHNFLAIKPKFRGGSWERRPGIFPLIPSEQGTVQESLRVTTTGQSLTGASASSCSHSVQGWLMHDQCTFWPASGCAAHPRLLALPALGTGNCAQVPCGPVESIGL